MSKKHKKSAEAAPDGSLGRHAAEYKIIKHDLIKVVYLNVIYLALVFALYASNSKSHYLENWFSKVFKF